MGRATGFKTQEFYEVYVDGKISEIRIGSRLCKVEMKYGAVYSYFNVTHMGIIRDFFNLKGIDTDYKDFKVYCIRLDMTPDMLPPSVYFRQLKSEIKRGKA